MSKAEDVLLPPSVEITVEGTKIEVKKLSIKQTLELGKVVLSAAATMADRIPPKDFARMQANQTSNTEDMVIFLSALEEADLTRLLSVLSGKKQAWCDKHFDFDSALDLLIAVNEVQPLKDILGKVRKLQKSLATAD